MGRVKSRPERSGKPSGAQQFLHSCDPAGVPRQIASGLRSGCGGPRQAKICVFDTKEKNNNNNKVLTKFFSRNGGAIEKKLRARGKK